MTALSAEPAQSQEYECFLRFAIYTADDKDSQRDSGQTIKAALEEAGWTTKVELLGVADYELPEDSYIGAQVDEAALSSVKTKNSVVKITLTAKVATLEPLFWAAHSAVSKAAIDLDGFVWDQGSWSLYTPLDWATAHDRWSAGHPFVFEHITIQQDRSEAGVRLVTVGLEKFGFPELAVDSVTPGERKRLGVVLSLLGQSLVERTTVIGDRAKLAVASLTNLAAKQYFADSKVGDIDGTLVVGLTEAERGQYDPQTTILTVQLVAEGNSRAEREAAALDRFLGKKQVEVRHTNGLSEAWKAASARAVKRLMELKPSLQAGLKANETLHVKMGFSDPGMGRE